MAPPQRPVFDSYALPLPRRRQGPAAALSFLTHLAIAILVLWRGAELVAGGSGPGTGRPGGGGGGGRPAVSWFALPSVSVPQAYDIPPAPVISVPMIAVAAPVKIDVPPPNVVVPTTTPPAAMGTRDGTTGGPGQGPGTGGGTGTGTGTGVGADSGSGSGGDGDYIHPADVRGLIIPPECARGNILARFWVEADGNVSRVDVNPVPKDAGCRRELIAQLKAYKFRPARTRAGMPVASVFQIRLVH